MPIDQLIDIDCHRLVFIFDAFYVQSRFQKYGLLMHFNDENSDKTLIFLNGDWYIVENMGIRFSNNINSQLAIKLMNCDETVIKED